MNIEINDDIVQKTTKCRKNFSCLSGEITHICKVEECMGEIIFIKCKEQSLCEYRTYFGYSQICSRTGFFQTGWRLTHASIAIQVLIELCVNGKGINWKVVTYHLYLSVASAYQNKVFSACIISALPLVTNSQNTYLLLLDCISLPLPFDVIISLSKLQVKRLSAECNRGTDFHSALYDASI
jgi:hypothetical protein